MRDWYWEKVAIIVGIAMVMVLIFLIILGLAIANPPRADRPHPANGVPEGTKDSLELRAAYLKRLKETHPDTGGREEDFLAVREAAAKLGII